jgi:hypothetical protein
MPLDESTNIQQTPQIDIQLTNLKSDSTQIQNFGQHLITRKGIKSIF